MSEPIGKKSRGPSGVALFCGTTDWEVTTTKASIGKVPRVPLRAPNVLGDISDEKIVKVVSGPAALHFVLINANGAVFTFGRNDQGQLGLGDEKPRNYPTAVKSLQSVRIVDAAVGRRHTMFLAEDGTVYAVGDNRCGQLGIGTTVSISTPRPVKTSFGAVRKVACGAEFSMFIDKPGYLFACGHPEYGQLGDGQDGKYFVSASKLSFHWVTEPQRIVAFLQKGEDGQDEQAQGVAIVDIACGNNHTLALDAKKRVFSWGFGGYGRLGHTTNKDEMLPRLIQIFGREKMGATKIACGGTSSFAVNELDQFYFWGQLKASGEATMYPKPMQELSGWPIDHISVGNKHVAIVSGTDVITWGSAPTHGELGYGERCQVKSSTTPNIAAPFKHLHICAVACGYANTLFVADTSFKETTDFLPKLDTYESSGDVEQLEELIEEEDEPEEEDD